MARQELAIFLRARRAALRPGDVGLKPGATASVRRTPGLRREEVAELAHVSVDYYTRMEQARGPRPSDGILEGLAQALRLTPAERSHMFRLAGAAAPPPPAGAVHGVRPHIARMLERLPDTGAIVTDASYGIVAWNPMAEVLLGGRLGRAHGDAGDDTGGERTTNLARRRFLGEGPVYESSSAEEFGRIVVARLRRSADRYPHDPELTALLAELRDGSEEFRRIWASRPVHAPGHRTKVLLHPEVGQLRLNCDVLLVPEDDQEVVLMTADLGSPEARALHELMERHVAASATVQTAASVNGGAGPSPR